MTNIYIDDVFPAFCLVLIFKHQKLWYQEELCVNRRICQLYSWINRNIWAFWLDFDQPGILSLHRKSSSNKRIVGLCLRLTLIRNVCVEPSFRERERERERKYKGKNNNSPNAILIIIARRKRCLVIKCIHIERQNGTKHRPIAYCCWSGHCRSHNQIYIQWSYQWFCFCFLFTCIRIHSEPKNETITREKPAMTLIWYKIYSTFFDAIDHTKQTEHLIHAYVISFTVRANGLKVIERKLIVKNSKIMFIHFEMDTLVWKLILFHSKSFNIFNKLTNYSALLFVIKLFICKLIHRSAFYLI